MLLELSVLSEEMGPAASRADLIKIMNANGVHYELTNEGTILEGSWDELMDIAKKCRDEALKKTSTVTTIMHADDCARRPCCSCKNANVAATVPPAEMPDDDGDWGII